MSEGRTVFAQLLDFLPKYEFDKCVARYHGNYRVRKLPTYEQFLVMAFAQKCKSLELMRFRVSAKSDSMEDVKPDVSLM